MAKTQSKKKQKEFTDERFAELLRLFLFVRFSDEFSRAKNRKDFYSVLREMEKLDAVDWKEFHHALSQTRLLDAADALAAEYRKYGDRPEKVPVPSVKEFAKTHLGIGEKESPKDAVRAYNRLKAGRESPPPPGTKSDDAANYVVRRKKMALGDLASENIRAALQLFPDNPLRPDSFGATQRSKLRKSRQSDSRLAFGPVVNRGQLLKFFLGKVCRYLNDALVEEVVDMLEKDRQKST